MQEELMDAILYIQTAQEELKDILDERSKDIKKEDLLGQEGYM